RAAHLGDGDQVRADAHPVPGVALRAHADGPRDRKPGRHHHARPRERQALPRVYREGTPGQDGIATDRGCVTARREGKKKEASSIPAASAASTRNTFLKPPAVR